tara:strand:+ start:9511 stop:9912 length:402 start_codon:yes stop_codon:yes gene_type:complete
VIVDEGFCTRAQLLTLAENPARWIANLRVSKLAGLRRSLELARAAQQAGIDAIVGAQVGETSILTRAALALHAGLFRPALDQEGAFGTRLLRDDLVETPLMFSDGGWIDSPRLPEILRDGLGLAIVHDRVQPL